MCHLQRSWASRGVASGGSIQAPFRAAYRWGTRESEDLSWGDVTP